MLPFVFTVLVFAGQGVYVEPHEFAHRGRCEQARIQTVTRLRTYPLPWAISKRCARKVVV